MLAFRRQHGPSRRSRRLPVQLSQIILGQTYLAPQMVVWTMCLIRDGLFNFISFLITRRADIMNLNIPAKKYKQKIANQIEYEH
jgi:hypothetical protein